MNSGPSTDAVQLIESMPGKVALFSEKFDLLVCSAEWKKRVKLPSYLKSKDFKAAWMKGFQKTLGIPTARFEEMIFFKNSKGQEDCCRLLMSLWQGRSVLVSIEHSDFHREVLAELDQFKTLQISKAHFEEMSEMAGGLAHEINNPLTVVLFKSVQIRKMLLVENLEVHRSQLQDSNAKVIVQTERIAKIVKSLMNFSRDASGDPLVSCPITTLVEESIALSSEKIRLSGVEVVRKNIALTEAVFCRPVQIMQVLVNILNNASDALLSRSEPVITISIRHVDKFVDILVSDNGPGVPKGIEEKIFKPFFTTKEAGKGSGLGLSISYGIMAKHGGKLFLDRSVSNSCFVVRLPLIKIF